MWNLIRISSLLCAIALFGFVLNLDPTHGQDASTISWGTTMASNPITIPTGRESADSYNLEVGRRNGSPGMTRVEKSILEPLTSAVSHARLSNDTSSGSPMSVSFIPFDAGLTGVGGSSTSIADVNGDGNRDLLITGEDANENPTTTLYLGDGQGGFSEAGAGLTNVDHGSTSIADVDGDGNRDLLITGEDATDENETTTLYLGDGQGGFSEAGAGLTGVELSSTSIADVNGDGNKDLLIAGLDTDRNQTATLYLGDGQGGFSEAEAGLTGIRRGSTSIADVDGDGNQDLLITGYASVGFIFRWTATLYLGDGQGGFSEAEAGLTGVEYGSTSIADVDGDGNQDLLITGEDTNSNLTATLYLGDGQGGFSEAEAGLTGVSGFGTGRSSSSIADVDGDGNQDLLITGNAGTSLLEPDPTATLYLGDGQGGFNEAGAGLTGVYNSSTSIADVDGDGAKDLLITGFDEEGPTAILYENQSVPSDPLTLSIEGRRITDQTLPSEENTPVNEVPHPPNRKDIFDQYEVTRYAADRLVVRARVGLSESFDGSVEDISVEGTLDGQTMQTVIRDSVDADGDGKIDALPFDHYKTGDGTEYADVLLVSSQNIESGSENLSLSATATTSSGSQSQASEEVSMYYAKHGESGRPFDPQTDGYQFKNLKSLSYEEVRDRLFDYGVFGGVISWYENLTHSVGRCFGMAGTSGIYFDNPDEKFFSGNTYDQVSSNLNIKNKISNYHLAQEYTDIKDRLQNPDFYSEYITAKGILENGSPPMIAIRYDDGGLHSVLATKLTVLEGQSEAVFEFHDSNLPGTAYDFSYNLETNEKKASFDEFGQVTKFATLDISEVPFTPGVGWFLSVIGDQISDVGEVFTSAFTSSDKSGKTATAATKNNTSSGEAVYVVVENDQGQQAGHLADGTKVNEIDGAVVEQVVTDSATGEKATYVAVPPGETYTASIATSGSGDVNFEHAVPMENSKAEIKRAEDMSFTDASSGTYDETDEQIELDKDGDGTVDETISTESSTIPVELASFDAYAEGSDGAVLTWQTASEQNNAGFEVQHRATDSGRWRTLGFVDSKASGGTTSQTNTYRYAAEDLSVGTHRFRLKQEDLDGTSTLTDPVTVRLQMQKALKLTAPSPNPAQKTAALTFALKGETEATVAVYNTLGQRVKTLYDGVPTAGESQRLRLDTGGLSSGTYFIRLEAAGKTKTERLTVVR